MNVQLRVALGALGLALVVGCSHDKAAAQGPYARQVADAIPMIERGTGLKFKHPPVLQTKTRDQVRAFLEQQFTESLSEQEIAGEQILYRRLGLIPDTLDLRTFMLNLLTEQVAGFYDPKTKVLYVVPGDTTGMVGFVISHELVHALQDQYMNLDSIQQVHGQNDRTLAAQAVIEGQATLVPIQGMYGPAAELPGGWDRMRDLIRENQSSMPLFAAAPMIVQETLIFPYLNGAEFVRRFETAHPGQQPYGKNMPTSTEQILSDSAYFGHPPDEPTAITLPAVTTGTVLYEDDMGEFETRLFLFKHLEDQNAAIRGAAGWDGDRYAVIRTPKGDGIVWLSVWDSPVDAAEFGSEVEQVIGFRFHSPAAHETPRGKSYALADGRTITLWGGTVAGRPAVLYEDLPAGVDANIIDLAKVRLTQPAS